ncbi:organ-specific protein S2-like [Juglans microcarpa x Juglans regia]|uniref:organ-specific protein S2-like n=1 Tax=Juglans microcarpa x Juglans regia TaxID=2249226 RepID=UPI001B7F6014|nr:organ-specific protein S2-like [Juglans microcarpa x Juglans regia]
MIMNSRIAWLVAFFSVLLIAADHGIEARKGPGEYWISVMKEQPMPEALQVLVPLDSSPSQLNKNADDCHTPELGAEINKLDQLVEDFKHKADHDHKQRFVKDFEPRPNISAYGGDDDIVHESEKKFIKDFEPRPNISAYTDDHVHGSKERAFAEEFEQTPDVTIYHE